MILDICRTYWGDFHKKGLRNIIFKFLRDLNEYKLETKMDIQSSTEYIDQFILDIRNLSL